MTGGTALPADFSPHPAPNAPDEPGSPGDGEVGPGNGGNSDGAGRNGGRAPDSGGQPKPFFAEQPEQFELGQQRNPEPQGAPPNRPYLGPPYGQPGLGPVPGRPGDQPPSGISQRGQQDQRDQSHGRLPAPPQQRPRPQQSLEAPGRELRQRAIASLAFGVISMVALLGLGTDLRKGVYLLGFSAAVGVAACVIGISALVKARRTGSYRPRWAIGGIVLGALATVISVPILVTYLAFPTQVNDYVNCLSQAQNSTQQQACMSKFYRSIRLGTAGSGPLGAGRETVGR